MNTDSAISCYRAVDRALYRAKQKGRNHVEALAPDGPEHFADTAGAPGSGHVETPASDDPEHFADTAGAPGSGHVETPASDSPEHFADTAGAPGSSHVEALAPNGGLDGHSPVQEAPNPTSA